MNQENRPRPLQRRHLLTMAAGAAAAAALPLSAHAQTSFATRPVRILVPFAPGGATDTIARVLGQRMSQDFGQPVVVESKSGATGLLAGEVVVRSVPDGTTVVLGTTSSMLTNKYLYKKTAARTRIWCAPLSARWPVPTCSMWPIVARHPWFRACSLATSRWPWAAWLG